MITLYNILGLFIKGELYSDTPVYSKESKLRTLTTDVIIQLTNGQLMTIHKGFTWDENSIPWILQPLFPKSGLYAPSALIHDALYYLTVHNKKWVEMEYVRWMASTNVSVMQIFFRYLAVTWFGGRWWNRNKSNPSVRARANRRLITLVNNQSVETTSY